MDGILLIDKPSGPTSHDICQTVKKSLKVKKVGHAGTLDPLATGLLVVLLDGATKMQSIFLGKAKEYEFTLRLGEERDTYDRLGKITAVHEVPADTLKRLPQILDRWVGEVLQTPPPYSAIKKNGKPLYRWAREGKPVLAAPRKIRIDFLKVVSASLPDVTLNVRCSSGSYVRSLAHDIGMELGVLAHVVSLRRLRSEPFSVEEAIRMEELG